jgi:atlastin
MSDTEDSAVMVDHHVEDDATPPELTEEERGDMDDDAIAAKMEDSPNKDETQKESAKTDEAKVTGGSPVMVDHVDDDATPPEVSEEESGDMDDVANDAKVEDSPKASEEKKPEAEVPKVEEAKKDDTPETTEKQEEEPERKVEEKNDHNVDDSEKKNAKEETSEKETEEKTDSEEDYEDLSSEHPHFVPKRGEALQIVSIGNEEDKYAFHFHKDAWMNILKRVPTDKPVAIISVVGAFRTGKSFLLSWFLRYLHHLEQETDTSEVPWYRQFESLGNDGFDWKAGSERNTTGIWMWNCPFILKEVAVLLVDTQGMFDHETTMDLTASIFGFSTLLSSYQIYNVDKRIQEDHLQQLALFSEYARAAMRNHADDDGEQAREDAINKQKPFQRIEFLVRDWQHFEDEEDFEGMIKSMDDYLQKVIAERDAKDLQDTRIQILSCFEAIKCYGLVHPGFAVTKKKYTGSVSEMEPLFLKLLDRYCQRVFSSVEAKSMHGQTLTAVEFGSYIEAYANLFASGASLPTAATLLEATASANNTNAIQKAVQYYQERMDHISGPQCSNYIPPEELQKENMLVKMESLRLFESMATFGSEDKITEAKERVLELMVQNYTMYESLNEGRNPLSGLEV